MLDLCTHLQHERLVSYRLQSLVDSQGVLIAFSETSRLVSEVEDPPSIAQTVDRNRMSYKDKISSRC